LILVAPKTFPSLRFGANHIIRHQNNIISICQIHEEEPINSFLIDPFFPPGFFRHSTPRPQQAFVLFCVGDIGIDFSPFFLSGCCLRWFFLFFIAFLAYHFSISFRDTLNSTKE
jgi:hypothetical protein